MVYMRAGLCVPSVKAGLTFTLTEFEGKLRKLRDTSRIILWPFGAYRFFQEDTGSVSAFSRKINLSPLFTAELPPGEDALLRVLTPAAIIFIILNVFSAFPAKPIANPLRRNSKPFLPVPMRMKCFMGGLFGSLCALLGSKLERI